MNPRALTRIALLAASKRRGGARAGFQHNVFRHVHRADHAIFCVRQLRQETTATGPTVQTSPCRFSTKPWDNAALLSYYGSRYYSMQLEKWLPRDVVEEYGENPYQFVRNNALSKTDYLGFSEDGPYSAGVEWVGRMPNEKATGDIYRVVGTELLLKGERPNDFFWK